MTVLIKLVLITLISIQVLQAQQCTTPADCQSGGYFHDQTITEKCGRWWKRERCTKLVRVCVCVTDPAKFIRDLCGKRTNKQVFYLADPRNSNRFIQCDVSGQAFQMDCPSGTIWDDTKKRCDFQ